jgi:thiamine kinase-like enzyme
MIRPTGIQFEKDKEPGVNEVTIVSMLGNEFERLSSVEVINTSSRNVLQRLQIEGQTGNQVLSIGKWYLPQLDRFYEHRFRREEKILDLLNKWFKNQVPKVYGGLIVPGRFGYLVMQDLGPNTLEHLLTRVGADERNQLINKAVRLLAEFHLVTDEHHTSFHRVIYSIELDRLTLQTYNRKLRIAVNRLLHLCKYIQGKTDTDIILRETLAPNLGTLEGVGVNWRQVSESYNAAIVKALIGFPKTIVHNSYAPSHLLWHDERLKLIDFETITVGPPQVDLAEFLRHPAINLSVAEVHQALSVYQEASNGLFAATSHELFERTFWLANVSRALDYAGTLARRFVKYSVTGNQEEAQICYNRALEYLGELELSSLQSGTGLERAPFYQMVESLKETLRNNR